MAHINRRGPRLGIMALVVVGLVLGFGLLVLDHQASGHTQSDDARPDVLFIDAMRDFGPLERPPSLFKHDFHVLALADADGKTDCRQCHRAVAGDSLSFRFLRLEQSTAPEVKEIYHDGCVSCHLERATARAPGAEACGACHQRQPAIVSSARPMGMDNSLHARHVIANERKCDRCHHQYDPQKRTLYYEKGRENSCRDCHRAEGEENRVSFRRAAHAACVNCHLGNGRGPRECAGCHDALRQQGIAMLDSVPRLERGQPDAVLIHAAPEDLDDSTLPTVPFDHLFHERANATCRICHHEGMEACRNCHTLGGAERGDRIPLAIAMHAPGIDHSCVGCHDRQKVKAECAGCHGFMQSKGLAESYCQQCHAGPLPSAVAASGAERWPADQLFLRATPAPFSFATEDVPDSVAVAHMVDKYEAAVFPHRRIVAKLRSGIAASALAMHAHGSEDLVCQGCHHHSPVGVKPPPCSNCHGAPFQPENIYAPGLYGAYHRQCLGCHQKMGRPTGCTDCHANRAGGVMASQSSD